jgi:O-antigen/teichoic acid export membrane protein
VTAAPPQATSFRHALSWSYVQTGGRMAATLLVSLILARLLGPEAFGVIAMATVYVYFIELLGRQGLAAAIIQRPVLTQRHLDTAFWLVLAVVGALVPVAIGLSGVWARLNRVPELGPIIIGLTPVLVCKGLAVVPEAKLRRALAFRELALRTNLATVVGGVIGITMAAAGFGVWSLVGQQVALSVVELIALWRLTQWRPRLAFDRRCARDLIGFSGLSSVAGLGSFLQLRVDALLIGLILGPVAVGLFRFVSRLTDMVVEFAGGALHAVSLPELSRFSADQQALNGRIHDLIRLATLIVVPPVALLALVSEPLLLLIGGEWAPAVVGLQILCASAYFQVLSGFIGPGLQASGRPGTLAALAWAAAGISGVAFTASGLFLADQAQSTQVAGLALARTVASLLVLAMVLPVLRRRIGLRSRSLILGTAPLSLAATLTVLMIGFVVERWDFVSGAGPATALLVTGVIGVAALVIVTAAVEPLSRTYVADMLRRRRAGGSGRTQDDAVPPVTRGPAPTDAA